MSHLIYSGTPSLPHTFDYTPEGDERVLLSLSGTAWTRNPHGKIGLELVVGGQVVNTAAIWSNAPNTHRALHTGLTTYQFPFNFDINSGEIQPVSITIRAIAGTEFDGNDYVTIAHV